MTSTQEMRDAWAPPCTGPGKHYVTIPMGNQGARVTVDARCEDAFRMLSAITIAHRYAIRPGDTGAYNCRRITGGTGWSLHAYGIAADLNWSTNPYGSRLVTDMPPAMIRDIEALRTRNGKVVFRWGGRYSGNKDAMHFEVICTPADLATGVVGERRELTPAARAQIVTMARIAAARKPFLYLIPQDPQTPEHEPYMGEQGREHQEREAQNVRDWQNLIGVANTDGIFGPGTQRATAAFQKAWRLYDEHDETEAGEPKLGSVDRKTWELGLFFGLLKFFNYA